MNNLKSTHNLRSCKKKKICLRIETIQIVKKLCKPDIKKKIEFLIFCKIMICHLISNSKIYKFWLLTEKSL